MDCERETVAIHRIDLADDYFRISTGAGAAGIEASLRTVGLIHPPFLLEQPNGYTVVSGFRRVGTCRELGWKEMPACVFGRQSDRLALARLAISDNAGQRPLNLLESARCVALLARHLQSASELPVEAGLLGLSGSGEMTRKLLALSRLPGPIQAAVADATLCLPMALALGQEPAGTALALTRLFSELQPSLNRQRELVELLNDISRREGMPIEEILAEGEPAGILAEPAQDRNRKARLLRDYLIRRRFPAISRAEKAFAHWVDDLALEPGVCLTPARHFEGRNFTLSLSFCSRRELEARRDTLNRLLQHAELDPILRGPRID